jgi:hypothetical protein
MARLVLLPLLKNTNDNKVDLGRFSGTDNENAGKRMEFLKSPVESRDTTTTCLSLAYHPISLIKDPCYILPD